MIDKIIVFIIGPTCVGKTNLAIDLINFFPFEIINIDSTMIYKYMDIGTGKPSFFLLNKIKHHLVNIRDPKDNYSVFDFCRDAFFIINACWLKNKIPLFVGGSIMYFCVLYNYLYKLNIFDNKAIFNKFFVLNNIKLDLFFKFTMVKIGIIPYNRHELIKRIKLRLHQMISNGFLDEVYFLYNYNNLNLNYKSMKSIGYKEIWSYFDGKSSFQEAVSCVLNSTVNLSDKQLMWLKKFQKEFIFFEYEKNKIISFLIDLINRYIF